MRAWIRALGPSRPELLGLAALSAGVLVLVAALILRLASFGIPPACFEVSGVDDLVCDELAVELRAYFDMAGTMGGIAFLALGVLPPLFGVIAGISIVATDLENGTTEFAWSISPSRRRWLASRVIPLVLAIALVGGAAGYLADLLESQRQPTIDAQRSFDDLGFRGPLIPALSFAALGVSLVVSSVVGRVLPAFLLAASLVGASMLGIVLGNEAILRTESIVVIANDDLGASRRLESLLRTREGEIISFEEAYARFGTAAVDELDPALGLTLMIRIVPGDLYPVVAWRMALLYAIVGLATTTAAFAVVDRRRP